MTDLEHRYEILFLYDCTDCNPNGDPLDDNRPRTDPETGQATVTDVRIKRTVRDWFLEQEPDVGKRLEAGREILVRDTLKSDGHLSEGKDRAGQFLQDVGKGKKGVEKRDALHAEVVKRCIDARLFGATLPLGKGDPSLQLTGPVQFSAFNRSLHRVSPQLVQQTAAYAGKASADKKSFAERWLLPYALIVAYGVVNENAAATTEMRKEDLDALVTALWQGAAGLNSHSKIGHQPLMLMLLQYRPGYRLGTLPGCLRLTEDTKPDTALRSTDDYRLNVGELLGALAGYEPLGHISVHQDPRLRCTDGEAEGGVVELAEGRGLSVSPLQP
jgi:CRISPR-associated protein Csh2